MGTKDVYLKEHLYDHNQSLETVPSKTFLLAHKNLKTCY